jgi:hypothetical protein
MLDSRNLYQLPHEEVRSMSFISEVEYLVLRYIGDMETLASAAPSLDIQKLKDQLTVHLREIYKLCPDAFNPTSIKKIKTFSEPGGARKNQYELVSADDNDFVSGHYYLSENGTYMVIHERPFPRITPEVYPPCNTPYYRGYMWEEHRRILKDAASEQDRINNRVRNYVAPKLSARGELEQLKAQYLKTVQEAHRHFMQEKGILYKGIRHTEAKRTANCWAQKKIVSTVLSISNARFATGLFVTVEHVGVAIRSNQIGEAKDKSLNFNLVSCFAKLCTVVGFNLTSI